MSTGRSQRADQDRVQWLIGVPREQWVAMIERSLRHHLEAGTCLQARELPAVMAAACKALEGASNIEATALGIAEFLESMQ